MASQPNVLFIMTDQQRFDTIAALGNDAIRTPNIDRLVRRGVTYTNAYSTCPVCMPARYTIRSGCEPTRTGVFANTSDPSTHENVAEQCGPYLGERMRSLGYRTFGVGKFHNLPWDADEGFETQLHSEELYGNPDQRQRDAYASWIAKEHPAYSWIEALMGERTEMYYVPQMSPLPASLTVEAWTADRAIELIREPDERPYFGFVSFIGPHPPLAPPLPFNRMYDPDRMRPPTVGSLENDHLDQQIPWMNYAVFAEDVSETQARTLTARYYGEISYIDQCIGTILDEVESRADARNTLICFYSDHGDHMGDHHAWQKESFFEASTRIPFLLSWPERLPQGQVREDLVCLTDLFGIATSAAGHPEVRQGADVLAAVERGTAPREVLYGVHGRPGTRAFKAMVRMGDHKLIWMANGNSRLLFDLRSDPDELAPLVEDKDGIANHLYGLLVDHLRAEGLTAAFDGESLKSVPYEQWPLRRIYQFDASRGVTGFPDDPAEILDTGTGNWWR